MIFTRTRIYHLCEVFAVQYFLTPALISARLSVLFMKAHPEWFPRLSAFPQRSQRLQVCKLNFEEISSQNKNYIANEARRTQLEKPHQIGSLPPD